MAKGDNSISYSYEDGLGRIYTLSIDQNEWVRLTAKQEDMDVGDVCLDGETMEHFFSFWRSHVNPVPGKKPEVPPC